MSDRLPGAATRIASAPRPLGADSKELARWSALATAMVTAGFVALIYWSHKPEVKDDTPAIRPSLAIEAALAYKSDKAPSPQPQKDVRSAAPPPDERGISSDPSKTPSKPVEPPPRDLEADFAKFRRGYDDGPTGSPDAGGSSDGSERGWAEQNKGDPYYRALAAAALNDWEYPRILDGSGEPAGCVLLHNDGSISDQRLMDQTKDETLNDAAERALTSFRKAWNQAPKPMPEHLIAGKTTRWICFRYRLSKN